MSKRARNWCSGTKINHATEPSAEAHRRHLERTGHTAPGKRTAIYWCQLCQAWHVTTNERIPADVLREKNKRPDRA